ncbi:MAG: hypothetical protein PHD51_04595 [Patescibacteria group bacterium]|nr:hypothetical protein [Patescibacteria group bacterium]MDD5490792.1 hypothetical protein [Patescibacteria group bacterium]
MSFETKEIEKIFDGIVSSWVVTIISLPLILPLLALCYLTEGVIMCIRNAGPIMRRIVGVDHIDRAEACKKVWQYHSRAYVFLIAGFFGGPLLSGCAILFFGARVDIITFIASSIIGFLGSIFFTIKRDLLCSRFPGLENPSRWGFR